MSYCLKCKKKTKSKNISYVKSKNIRVIQKGTCLVCGSKKSEFITKHKQGGDKQKPTLREGHNWSLEEKK